jgi:GNAT superfamily N-acetyltransferase
VWNAPNTPNPKGLELLRLAFRMLPPFGWRVPRAIRAFNAIEALHPKRPHWYLGILGTDPPHQGKGVGRALIEPVLARADEDRLPAWLEASRPENVPYYERFGFDVSCQVALPGGGPPIFGMLRQPRR